MDHRGFRIALVVTVFGAGLAGVGLAWLVESRLGVPEHLALIEVGVGATGGLRSGGGETPPLDAYRDPIVDRSLFDSSPGGGKGGDGSPRVSDLEVRLLATSTAERPLYSSALISVAAEEAEVFAVGDRIADAVIERIDREQVTVRRDDGREELLRLGAGAGASRRPPRPGNSITPSGKIDWAAGVEALGDGRFRLDRGTLDDALTHLDELAHGAGVAPNFRDGRAAGYRIVKIRGNSPLKLLGLERNDVIVGVDGQPIDPKVALDLLQRVGELDQLQLQLERAGEPLELTYELD